MRSDDEITETLHCSGVWKGDEETEKGFALVPPLGVEKHPAQAPRNNQGRSECFWCKKKTRKIEGFTARYDYCDWCDK